MSTHERAVEHALLLAGQVLDATTADEAAAAMDRVYTDDVVWEIPGRQLFYTGKEAIKDAYRRLLESAGDFSVERLDRFAAPERVIDDAWVHFKIIGDGFPNAPVPVGSLVTLRLVQERFVPTSRWNVTREPLRGAPGIHQEVRCGSHAGSNIVTERRVL